MNYVYVMRIDNTEMRLEAPTIAGLLDLLREVGPACPHCDCEYK